MDRPLRIAVLGTVVALGTFLGASLLGVNAVTSVSGAVGATVPVVLVYAVLAADETGTN